METVHQFQSTKIIFKKGDITKEAVMAIVNAANSGLLGGASIDNAIHRAGGYTLFEECKLIKEKQGRCLTGEAVITTGGDLSAEYVIHAVGPVWRGGQYQEDDLLQSAYKNSLKLAMEYEVKTIAFPAISIGAYGYPIERAAKISLTAITNFLQDHGSLFEEVRMVFFEEKEYHTFIHEYRHCAPGV